MKKTWKRDTFERIRDYDDLNDLERLIKRAREAEKAGTWREFRTAYFNEEYSEGQYLALVGERPETDKEREAREQAEAEANKRREEWERKQFEALKKKFEGKNNA